MSIASQNRLAELEKRVAELEALVKSLLGKKTLHLPKEPRGEA